MESVTGEGALVEVTLRMRTDGQERAGHLMSAERTFQQRKQLADLEEQS